MKKKIALLFAAFCALILAACGSNTGGSTNSSTDSSDSSSTPEPTHVHSVAKVDGKAPTCTKEGSVECYFCWDCKSYFLDENAEEEITKEETVVAPPQRQKDRTDGSHLRRIGDCRTLGMHGMLFHLLRRSLHKAFDGVTARASVHRTRSRLF